MGHESRIEPWLPMTTVLLVSFRTDWLRREDTMKTAWKETGNRWAAVFSIRMDGAAGQNRTCSSTWGWKQEKFQRWGKCFLLTSPSIEQLISVVIFSSKPCAHKTFQFLQRESAIFSAKLFLRTIATGTGKAAALVFLSAAAGTGVISADFTHDSIQESYSPDSTRRSKEGPLLASRS